MSVVSLAGEASSAKANKYSQRLGIRQNFDLRQKRCRGLAGSNLQIATHAGGFSMDEQQGAHLPASKAST